jgi:hypothetical protein
VLPAALPVAPAPLALLGLTLRTISGRASSRLAAAIADVVPAAGWSGAVGSVVAGRGTASVSTGALAALATAALGPAPVGAADDGDSIAVVARADDPAVLDGEGARSAK